MKHSFSFLLLIICFSVHGQPVLNVTNYLNPHSNGHSHLLDLISIDNKLFAAYKATGNVELEDFQSSDASFNSHSLVMHLSNTGKLVWKAEILSEESGVFNLAEGKNGSIWALGYSKGKTKVIGVNKTEEVESTGAFVFIAKFNQKGALLSVSIVEQTGSNRRPQLFSIAVNSQGSVFVTFAYYGSLEVNEKEVDHFDVDARKICLLSFHEDGQFNELIRSWEDIGTGGKAEVRIDEDDSFVVFGFTKSDVPLDDSIVLNTKGGSIYDELTSFSYIAKYCSEHKLLWYNKVGGRYDQVINDITFGSRGELYVLGHYFFECIFLQRNQLFSASDYERSFGAKTFYAKLSPNGGYDFVHLTNPETSREVLGRQLSIAQDDRVHMIGAYQGGLDLGVSKGGIPNAGWFYTIWDEDSIVSAQVLYDLTDSRHGYFVREHVLIKDRFVIGGFYHEGRPELMMTTKAVRLNEAKLREGMSSIVCFGNFVDSKDAPRKMVDFDRIPVVCPDEENVSVGTIPDN